MDYKEKYNAALERARQFSEHPLQEDSADIVEYIFPELKEDNNDEKIRKALIEMIHDTTGDECEDCYHVSKESVLAWLEKQGKKKDTCKREIDDSYLQGICDAICEIEKQGEHKPNPYFGTSFEYNGHIWGMCARDNGVDILLDKQLFKHLEKQDEQPIDKVESKFKVGDWLQYRHAEPFLVEKITEQGYCNGDSCLLFEWEDEIHFWTIEDAKDGDVLYSLDSNQPFIYKERPQFSQARGYCCINKCGEFAVWNTSKCVICTDKYIPATKEQRELLFQKMKEAGYEWDSEKKELKKIEPKMLDADEVIEWVKTKVYDDSTYGMAMIDQFKKDFGL